jgi:hypothetical protein
MRRALLSMLLVGLAAAAWQQAGAVNPDDVRVLFLTDCRPYSHWQSIGMAYSFKKSGQPGKPSMPQPSRAPPSRADLPAAAGDRRGLFGAAPPYRRARRPHCAPPAPLTPPAACARRRHRPQARSRAWLAARPRRRRATARR